MKLTKKSAVPTLEKGQLWQTEKGRVEIMEVGKTLTHYRLYQSQKRVPTNLGRIQVVQDYLRNHGGRLIRRGALAKAKA